MLSKTNSPQANCYEGDKLNQLIYLSLKIFTFTSIVIEKSISKKQKIKHKIFNILISSLLMSEVYSQTFHISGNVSSTSNPIKYASVTFIDERDTLKKYSAITDANGHYQLDVINTVKEEPVIPQTIELGQNYPNPFSTATEIQYKLNKQSDICMKIYNILGEEVRSFRMGIQTNGGYKITWDGRNNFGMKVSPGVYFYLLESGNESQVKKMIFTSNNTSMNIPVVSELYLNKLEPETKETNLFTSKTYSVKIENTDSTTPKILFSEFSDIIIQIDTTINFDVQEVRWKFLGLENETITSIAIDPVDPAVIYAGSKSDFSSGINGKLFKSINGGIMWDTLLVVGSYRKIIIDPSNHNIIYTVSGGIMKSEDQGETWQPIVNGIFINYETRVQSLAMNPENSKILYAGTGGFYDGAMYKSYDGGMHWNEIGNDSLSDGVVSIAIDPIDTNNIYAGTAWRCILWKSSNAGLSWFRTGLGENETFIHDICIDPQQPLIVYSGLRGVFKTEDGGINWENLNHGLPNVTIDVVKIVKHSSQLFIIATFGDDGGVYEYSNLQNQWVRIGVNNLHVSYYYSDLEISSNPDKLYFGGKGGVYVMGLKE